MLTAVQAAQTAKTSGGSSSGSGSSKSSSSSGNGYTGGTSPDDDTAPADEEEYDIFWQSVRSLGLGDVSATLVQEIADYGGIIEKPDGTVEWAPGWNAANYRLKMGQIGGLPGNYEGIS